MIWIFLSTMLHQSTKIMRRPSSLSMLPSLLHEPGTSISNTLPFNNGKLLAKSSSLPSPVSSILPTHSPKLLLGCFITVMRVALWVIILININDLINKNDIICASSSIFTSSRSNWGRMLAHIIPIVSFIYFCMPIYVMTSYQTGIVCLFVIPVS